MNKNIAIFALGATAGLFGTGCATHGYTTYSEGTVYAPAYSQPAYIETAPTYTSQPAYIETVTAPTYTSQPAYIETVTAPAYINMTVIDNEPYLHGRHLPPPRNHAKGMPPHYQRGKPSHINGHAKPSHSSGHGHSKPSHSNGLSKPSHNKPPTVRHVTPRSSPVRQAHPKPAQKHQESRPANHAIAKPKPAATRPKGSPKASPGARQRNRPTKRR